MKPIAERFSGKYEPVTESGCWLWTASINKIFGYGKISVSRSVWKAAHRVSWQIHRGPIPDGMLVLHHCDVPSCVRPEHLYLGTQLDNVADMIRRGRISCGADRYNAKLTAADVVAIRGSGEHRRTLAARYGVTAMHIDAIRRAESWRHIPC